ncbi:MAG: hypothetical protein ABR512_09810 [Desulfopila sp.]
MKTQRKLDKVLGEVKGRVQEEVGSLMGANIKLSDPSSRIISKADFFEELSGKKIAAKLAITGEIEGTGGIVIGIKDAIRLGGTLIMLPRAELDDVAKSENYTEEIEDSYGEIANIIAGSYTKGFEDSFSQDCRFVRKTHEVIAPAKVDIQSEEPFPEQYYYWVKSSMVLDGVEMGDLEVLLPAEPFGLEVSVEEASAENEPVQQPQSATADNDTQPESAEQQDSATPDNEGRVSAEEKRSENGDTAQQPPISDGAPELSAEDLAKRQKVLKKLLTGCKDTIAQEVGALLGSDISLGKPDSRIITKEQVFEEELDGKQVLATMEISGDAEGKAFLFVSLKDAIRIGSTLIMLPPTELEAAVNEEEFTADTEDAYGEIANIIAGVYTSVFQEQYSESLRFIKKAIETVAPLKVDTDSDDVIAQQHYYLSKSAIEISGTRYGDVTLLLPAELFGVSRLGKSDTDDAAPANEQDAAVQAGTEAAKRQPGKVDSDTGADTGRANADVLLIENNGEEADKIEAELQDIGITTQRISFNDSVNNYLSESLRLVIIVMREVDEQAYGIAIKVSSKAGAPIVAAGSQWTRSKVIKAVKYGVTDILLVPAENEEIREKINTNIIRLAA